MHDAAAQTVILTLDKAATGGRGVIRGVAAWVHDRESWRVGAASTPEGGPGGVEAGPESTDGVIGRISPSLAARWPLAQRRFLVQVSRVGDIPGANNVTPDDAVIGRVAVEHLLGKALGHFAFFGPPNSHRRRDAFVAAVEGGDRPVTRLDSDDADDALVTALGELPRPCGVLAFNDMMTVRLIKLAHRAGLVVPRDLAVLGVDNNTLETVFCPVSVSSIVVDFHRIGFEAARVLGRVFRGGDPLSEPMRIAPQGVIERHSSDFPGELDPLAVQAARVIRQRANEPPRLPQLLAHLPASYRTVDRRFHRQFGRSLGAELIRVRTERAKRLLSETHLPLPVIAEQLGYSHPNYFNVAFRREVGMPPAEYRRCWRSFFILGKA